jgi:hypothetical protein
MNNPAQFFSFCADCTIIYRNSISTFVKKDEKEMCSHGEHDTYTHISVNCRKCAEEQCICQRCGKPIES